MDSRICVIALGGCPTAVERMLRELWRAGLEPECRHVATEEAFLELLNERIDVILAETNLARLDVATALQHLQARSLDIPFIVVTSAANEAAAVACLQLGATDYLLNDRLGRLGPSVRRALKERQLDQERRQAEAALRESEARYRTISELTSDFAYALRVRDDGSLVYEWVTDALGRISGFHSDEISAPDCWLQLIHPDDHPVATRHLQQVLAGQASEAEFRIVTKSGEIRYLRDYCQPFKDGHGLLVYGAAKDVSEWKRAGRALRESEERYRRIVETAQEGICTCDAAGMITFVNRKFEELLGYSAPELTGTSVYALLDDELRPVIKAMFDRRRQGIKERYDLKLRHKDGAEIWVIVSANPLFDQEGRFAGSLAMFTDVTERKHAQDELQQAQKLESVGRLAAGIAHEINTPIQFVGDNVYFLRDSFHSLDGLLVKVRTLLDASEAGSVDPGLLAEVREAEEVTDLAYLREEVPKAIEQTLDGIGRVATIVQAMKAFAHPDQQEKVAVDLIQGLQSTLTVARNELKYVADVETDFQELPLVLCYPGDINQVFLNLLINAAHAIADTPRPDDRKGTIRIRTVREGDAVLVSISDSGCGIPREIRTKIFDQFFTTKEVGRGTGQGLALARAVIDRHGGTLTFDSEVGRGTTFSIRLPIGETFSEPVTVST